MFIVHTGMFFFQYLLFIQEKLNIYTGMLSWKLETKAHLNFHLENMSFNFCRDADIVNDIGF